MKQPFDPILRSLDVAAAPITGDQQLRADAALERLIASPGSAPVDHPRTRSFRPKRIVVGAGALAAAISAFLLGQGGGEVSYVSWTASPAPVSQPSLEAAVAACEDVLEGDDTIDLEQAEMRLAERRGDHVALLYRTENPDLSAVCLMRNPSGSTAIDDLDVGIGGSSGPALRAPRFGFTQGAIIESRGASITDGAVGAGVTGVTIHAGSVTVHATVSEGRYVAWWPGSAFADASAGADGSSDLGVILTYDLTLTDGRVVRDAQPTRPS